MTEKVFVYRNRVNWKKEKIGVLVVEEKPEITFTRNLTRKLTVLTVG